MFWGSEGRKPFFFEKKKQKTFTTWHRTLPKGTAKSQKFFGSFFQKRTSFLPLALLLCAAAPNHVVSLNLCTDQLLVLLAPERILALEPLARDPALSFVARKAVTFPRVQADAEAVLRLHPDLVLAGAYGAQTTVALLRQRGVRVVQMESPETFDAVERQLLAAGSLLGEQARSEALVATMRKRLAAIPRTAHRTAMLWEARGWTAGPGSLGDAVLRAAGLRNVGTGGQVGVEALLTHPPDLLVTQTVPDAPSLATDLVETPALASIPRARIRPELLICGGPYSVGAVEELAHASQ